MDAGQLYEKCVALGLCERARWDGQPLRWYNAGTPRWVIWEDNGPWRVPYASEAEDLACMTVLRALKEIPNDEDHAEARAKIRSFLVDVTYGDATIDLQSLCLCLLRAKGEDV